VSWKGKTKQNKRLVEPSRLATNIYSNQVPLVTTFEDKVKEETETPSNKKSYFLPVH